MRSAAAITALLALAGCAATDVMATDPGAYLADAPERIAAADWARATTLEMALSEFKYAPATLHLRAGEPYRLRLVNRGVEAHDLTSPAFFQAIAVQKLATPKGELAAPKLRSIGVSAGEAKELFFVPVVPGRYAFDCDEPLHALFGMTGEAVIE
jgi:uncharacterized cupredoxin-like copper-binding protein